MDDLLKEAIADAKAVRETALENAKLALQEAFTPKLQNMLSQKIQMEMEDEEGEEVAENEDEEAMEEDEMEAPAEEPAEEPAMEEDEEEAMEEQSKSSGIGAGDNKVNQVSASDEEDPQGAKLKEGEDKEEEMDEDIDLDEVLKALSEEEDAEEEMAEVAKLQSDLKEHRSVIETLRGKLNEVNLLNAKLLFTNKLFRKYGLNNEQKMKVVEQFDRASTLREVKLVYSTLGESFGARKNEINESKGAASKPVASTKSEKEVITESSDLRDRFKKLANLI